MGSKVYLIHGSLISYEENILIYRNSTCPVSKVDYLYITLEKLSLNFRNDLEGAQRKCAVLQGC